MSDSLNIQQGQGSAPEIVLVRLDGPLTLNGLPQLQAVFRGIEVSKTVIDLTGVPHMDSAGLGAILSFLAVQQKAGRQVVVANPSRRVKMLIELTKVNTILKVFPTVEEADQL